ncbi:MAG: guanine nucleotide-binding protein subunit alpha, partial [Candidatus Paceibacterota bacterium]
MRLGDSFPLELKRSADLIRLGHFPDLMLDKHMADDITALWRTKSMQAVYQRSAEFQLADSTHYTMKNIHRFAESDYLPTFQDLLNLHARTTVFTNFTFQCDNLTFTIVDIGGQRSERRKWLHFFPEVSLLAFVVAVSEYDMGLREDPKVKRMHESLMLFSDLFNGPWFKSCDIVLLLNKIDLFEAKIAQTDLNVCFPEYRGGKNYELALQYIEGQFKRLVPVGINLLIHWVCALDA